MSREEATRILAGEGERLRARFAGVRNLRVEPRGGQIWSRTASGDITVSYANDFWIVVELASARDCPATPVGGNVLLRFVIAR